MVQPGQAPRRYMLIRGPDAGKIVFEHDRVSVRGVRHVLVRFEARWPRSRILVHEDHLQPLPFVAGDRVEVLGGLQGEVQEVWRDHLVVHIPSVADCQSISIGSKDQARLIGMAA